MVAGDGFVPDWRDAAAYEPLLHVDCSLFAWEWLRRNPGYRAAAERALEAGSCDAWSGPLEAPEPWGLHTFEPPWKTVPKARPIWRTDVYPYVLCVHAGPPSDADSFDLRRFDAITTLVTAADGREHLLISDGFCSIRIDVREGSLKDGPVQLQYRLFGLASVERPLMTLRRLIALGRTGRFSRALHSAEVRAKRFILLLRAHDALSSGATQRAIAAELFSKEAGEKNWRVTAPSLRSRAQRLVRTARLMAAGGHALLLAS